ncbi:hypothetical protein [Pseudonocardia sp. GCM10023141]|uniref:hypothetical protein n=1 Tax=Pseudonocardia sp. GCM10023141 TaxID=3252653 RepID=UPI0036223E8A
MEHVIAWCGFLGAWLLVAGPIFQASLELREEDIQTDQIEAASATLQDRYPRVSPWWWLVPPVGYWLRRRRRRQFRTAVMQSLNPDQLDGLFSYVNKATGWFFVAGGAALIAVKETWELVELSEWPHALFWVLIVVMPLLCVVNTAVRSGITRHAVTSLAARSGGPAIPG